METTQINGARLTFADAVFTESQAQVQSPAGGRVRYLSGQSPESRCESARIIQGNVYWTDHGSDLIEVSRLNTAYRLVIISEGLDQPRAIAVHPLKGFLVWTETGRFPKISRSRLDGSQRTVLVNSELIWPSGIALDYQENKLYWCDARTQRIERIDLDSGRKRETVLKDKQADLFSVAVHGSYLYWTDRFHSNGSVRRGSKNDASGTVTLRSNLGKSLRDVKLCSCAHGYLAPDGVSCRVYDIYLLYGEKETLTKVHVSDLGASVPSYRRPDLFNNISALTVTYRQPRSRVFFSDAHYRNIQTVNDDWTGRRVIVDDEAFLILADRHEIRRISVDGSDYTLLKQVNECMFFGTCSQSCSNTKGSYKCSCHPNFKEMNGECITKGPDDQVLYLANDSEIHRFCAGFRHPVDLSADWVTGSLYWINGPSLVPPSTPPSPHYSINVGKIGGGNCTRLITDLQGEPFAISVNPTRGCPVNWTGAQCEKPTTNNSRSDITGMKRVRRQPMAIGGLNMEIGNPSYNMYELEHDSHLDVGEVLHPNFTLHPQKVIEVLFYRHSLHDADVADDVQEPPAPRSEVRQTFASSADHSEEI
ncbi:Low-density lipoprotein receptor-related protein 1B [Bagarius yarrelli]|uniref:Low-density lipoprotein receptor-related protein 1B n=1 Tax=Bagarius yarrelli TaxID=175774 RepID=A0A556U1X2_BAGYA|nr:Low-density lipoprotein receptor-related protein 1B [Bagarius yarrelli]